MIDEFEGQIIADKYRVDSLFHESDLGGFYRGWNLMMDKPVTIKILAPSLAIDERLVKRFIDEAKAGSKITHPNVLSVTDFGTDGRGNSYAIYEGCDGDALSGVISRDGALSVPHSLEIAAQAAAGLSAAHASETIHGSLSPEKILISDDEGLMTAKVFDLGFHPVGRTSTADVRYISPEQYDDPTACDERSDIYSLGVILYEMLAGELPFAGETIAELKHKQDSEPPPPLSAFRSDLKDDIEPMILTAMSIDPARRYQTMAAFAEDLQLMSGGAPKAAAETAAAAAAADKPKRNLWQTAFIVLAGMSVLAVALIYGTSVKKTDPTTQLQPDAASLPVQPIGPATGAQEESLAKLPAMTDAEIMASANMDQPPGTLPGGDGYNAWANGGAPPIGAPPQQYVPPGGQVYTIDPNGGSQFMPPEGGVVLVPVPANTDPATKPSPTPKTSATNPAVQPTPAAEATPKTLATPPKTEKSAATQPGKDKPAPAGKSGKSDKPKNPEEK